MLAFAEQQADSHGPILGIVQRLGVGSVRIRDDRYGQLVRQDIEIITVRLADALHRVFNFLLRESLFGGDSFNGVIKIIR